MELHSRILDSSLWASRAFDDDDYDIDPTPTLSSSPPFPLAFPTPSPSLPLRPSFLLLAASPSSSLFLSLLFSLPTSSHPSTTTTPLTLHTPPKSPSLLLALPTSPTPPAAHLWHIASSLLGITHASTPLVILSSTSSDPSKTYTPPPSPSPPRPFLRALYTSAHPAWTGRLAQRREETASGREEEWTPVLEQPNVETGVAAAVMSLCEAEGRRAAVYVVVEDGAVSGREGSGAVERMRAWEEAVRREVGGEVLGGEMKEERRERERRYVEEMDRRVSHDKAVMYL